MKIQKTNLKASSFLHMIAAASITVCMFTSCNGGLTEQSESDPAGTYRNYLLEVRKMKSISFEELSENLCQWQAIRDSVFNHVRQDTVGIHGQDLRKTCEGIHDSLRLEFSRLALSRPRSYQELFLLKRKLSSNDKDNGLIRTVEKIRPFFESLDKRPIHGSFIAFDMAVDDFSHGNAVTTWVRVRSNKENHIRLSEYLTKGRMVLVGGTLSTSLWKDKNGDSQIQLSITADALEFINTGKREGTTSEADGQAAAADNAPVPPADMPQDGEEDLPF